MFALEFPPLSHIVNWPGFIADGEIYEINKVVLIYGFAVVLTSMIFILGNKKQVVPTGAQNLAEISVEFVEQQLIEYWMALDEEARQTVRSAVCPPLSLVDAR